MRHVSRMKHLCKPQSKLKFKPTKCNKSNYKYIEALHRNVAYTQEVCRNGTYIHINYTIGACSSLIYVYNLSTWAWIYQANYSNSCYTTYIYTLKYATSYYINTQSQCNITLYTDLRCESAN